MTAPQLEPAARALRGVAGARVELRPALTKVLPEPMVAARERGRGGAEGRKPGRELAAPPPDAIRRGLLTLD